MRSPPRRKLSVACRSSGQKARQESKPLLNGTGAFKAVCTSSKAFGHVTLRDDTLPELRCLLDGTLPDIHPPRTTDGIAN